MSLKYKEIKYISHIARNFFLYFILFLVYFLIYDFHVTLSVFGKGLFVYVASYSAVYFFNDYLDREEDVKNQKSNLYLSIKNKKIFWFLAFALFVFGLVFSYLISTRALFWLLVIYLLNFIYSFRPLRLRDKIIWREWNLCFVNIVKLFLISSYLQFEFTNGIPWPLFLMGGAIGGYSTCLYKRHVSRNKINELILGILAVVFMVLSLLYYKQLLILLLPIFLILAFLSYRYKNSKIPIGFYQFIFFVYAAVLYLFLLY